MFGKRADGKLVKDIQIIDKAMPYFMPQRIDAANKIPESFACKPIDDFIAQQASETGVHYTYTEILIATMVRMLHEKPKANRFINNCKVYDRKYISISMSVMTSLRGDGEELTLKYYFTGYESLPEVKKIVDDEINRNLGKNAKTHETTKAAGVLCKLPGWLFKVAMGFVRFLDKHDMLPGSLIKISPFHTSVFFSDLRSISLGRVYHHLYNFGNTTIFCTLGKSKNVPIVDREGNITTEKQMELGFSLDDRACNGLYWSFAIRDMKKYLAHPELLMKHLPEPELSEKELKKKQKHDRKMQKKKQKEERKAS